MPSMIHIITFGLNLTGINRVALEADLPVDLLTDTRKAKYDALLPKIPNTDQTSYEWQAQRKLPVTSATFGAMR